MTSVIRAERYLRQSIQQYWVHGDYITSKFTFVKQNQFIDTLLFYMYRHYAIKNNIRIQGSLSFGTNRNKIGGSADLTLEQS